MRIRTDTGLEGWGESTPFGATYIAAHAAGVRAGIAEIAPHLLGRDPRRVDRINDLMDEALVGHAHAKTPLDVACWVVFGKAVGIPVRHLARVRRAAWRTDVPILWDELAMVSVTTAAGGFPVVDGRVVARDAPGLGVEPRRDVLGAPVATYGG